MAQRWTITLILISLTVPIVLITAFRVRDLPKSSPDSVKKQEKCDTCEVTFGQKWNSRKIDSGKYSKDEIKEDLQDTRSSLSIEVESSSNEAEDDADSGDFSFLKFQTGFIQEYPKEALNKLEEKLEIISKSFWNLFGDDSTDGDVGDKNDEDDDDDDDDDSAKNDNDYSDEEERMKIPVVITKSKFVDKKKEIDSKTNIKSDADSQKRPSNLKYKSQIQKRSAQESKQKRIHFPSDDEYYDDSDNTGETKSGEDIKSTIQKLKKKSSSTVFISKNILLEDTSNDLQYVHNEDKTNQNKIKEDIPKRLRNKNNDKLKSSNTISAADRNNDYKGYDDNMSGENEDTDEQEDNEVREVYKKNNFLGKGFTDSKESYYHKIKSHSDLKVKQSPKETTNKKPLNFELPKNINLEKDSGKGHAKIFTKTKPLKINSSKEVFDVEDEGISIKKSEIKNNDNIVTYNKNKELKKEAMKENKLNTETTNVKSSVHFSSLEKGTSDLKNVASEEIDRGIKKEEKVKKETLKLTKQPDENKIKIKTIPDHKNKSHEALKSTKSSEIIIQKIKQDDLDGNLEKSETKVKKNKQQESESAEQFMESHEIHTKNESNLKHITDALYRKNLHKTEFEDFYTFMPTFAPNFSRVHNPECRRHGQILLRQLRGTKLWALSMLDATAKIPSGLLQGNGIQLGDFEQCLACRARVQLDTGSVVKIRGKYCLAWVDIKAEHPDLETPVHLAQAKNLIKSRVDDPGHFVPRFSTLSWGVCVPSPCEPEDVEAILRDAIRHYQRTTGMVLRIKVNKRDCHTEKGADWWEKWLELPTVLTLSFYGVVIMLVCVATVQDLVSRRKEDEEQNVDQTSDKSEYDKKETNSKKEDSDKQSDDFLSIFSLYHTMKKLTAPGTTDDISCIHGIRAVATIALLIAHKIMPVASMPYTNRLKITEMVSSPLWSWCRAGWVFTDCFLLLSGALSAYRICTDNDSNAPTRLLTRYLRLTPALLAVVLFYTYVWDNISSGPMWGTFVTKNSEVCQEGWWWNLLYVQNFFGIENMCAPQTHQLALDMQLTVLGCIIVWLVQEKRGFTRLLLPAIHVFAAYSRYTTVRDHRLTLLAYRGVSVSQLYRTARLSYTSVLHRSTPYLVGISLGLALKKPTRHGKFVLTVGWIVSGVLWSLVWWAGFDSGSSQYRYNVTSAAQYASLTPIASALAISWVIYAVHNGCSELLSRLFCSRVMVVISRLSYAIYLCQFIIFITNIGTVRTSSAFTFMTLFDIQELSIIIVTSTIITLTLVIPMQSLRKHIFQSKIEISERKAQTADSKTKSKPSRDLKKAINEEMESSQIKHIKKIQVHREVLKEIPEMEIEYETQRDRNDMLEGILEEEENEEEMNDEEESQNQLDDDLVIVEEQGDEESWGVRDNDPRYYSREEDNDLEEWEWTANGRNSAQYLRYSR